MSLIFSTSAVAFAKNASIDTAQNVSSSTFLDAEGKENTVNIVIPQVGSAHVEYYIDGVLQNTVESNIGDDNQTNIVVTDVFTSTTQQFVAPVTDYISNNGISVDSISPMAYSYLGRINFKPYYDSFGYTYNYRLSVYRQTGSTTNEYKTINASKGTLASVAIAVIASVLSIIWSPLAAVATNLLHAAAYAAGTTIIGGVIQGLISKQYYVRTTRYDIKAIDPDTSRQRIYDAERYQVALSGGGYSSSYYYEGYLPWNSNTVAYWMFSDFWAIPYPGVKNYS